MKIHSFLFALTMIATSASAQGRDQPPTAPEAQYIQVLFDSTLSAFKSHPQDRHPLLLGILQEHLQIAEVSKFVAGNSWRLALEVEREAFRQAFADFVTSTAVRGLEKQHGLLLEISGVKRIEADVTEIISVVILPDRVEIPVNWIVETDKNRYAIRDIVFLGISMKTILRDFIASAISDSKGSLGVYAERLKNIGGNDFDGF